MAVSGEVVEKFLSDFCTCHAANPNPKSRPRSMALTKKQAIIALIGQELQGFQWSMTEFSGREVVVFVVGIRWLLLSLKKTVSGDSEGCHGRFYWYPKTSIAGQEYGYGSGLREMA